MTPLAQKLRKQPTKAEIRLWRLLYPFRTSGYHFRKQVQIERYVADFCCHHAKLVIEADGETHHLDGAQAYDAARDAYLCQRGYTVLRFSNDDILHAEEGVYLLVQQALEGSGAQPRMRSYREENS
jgi:very-short-patch-repair endonuclease